MTQSSPLVVLIGAPGSGKTRIGKRVARLLDVPFIDTDTRIEAAHGPISEIFAEHGEPYFRAIEREAVAAALAEPGVLSVGGGAVVDEISRAAFAQHRVALLTVTAEAVTPRIQGGKRPLLSDGIEVWKRLVAERAPIYAALAGRSWDTSVLPLDRIAAEIAEWAAREAGLPVPGSVPTPTQ